MTVKIPSAIFLATLCLILASPGLALDWKPVDPEILQLEKPKIDPDASAEAIFWETWVEDRLLGGSQPQAVYTTYLRIKIFTDKGAEDQSTVELSSRNGTRIQDLRARTIKPDGTIVPLKNATVMDKTLVRASGFKVKVKTFSMPDVQAGDVVDYQWKESRDNELSEHLRLHLQRDIPVWTVRYYVKPLDLWRLGYQMSSQAYNVERKTFQKANLGFYSVEYNDLPAFKVEPDMPPEDHLRSWVLLFYTKSNADSPEKYWRSQGKEWYKIGKREMKVDGAIKEAAAAIVGDATDPAEKLRRIREFCLTKITNINHDRFGVSAEERRDRKPNDKPSDTLKASQGSATDIIYLYGALLNAAGLDARVANVAGRDDSFFSPNLMDPYFLNRYNLAVKVDDHWEFSDPATPYLPHGMLQWPEEGVQALIPDPKEPAFVSTPISGPEDTVTSRKGEFRLLADGTLEGTVTVEATGHVGNYWKSRDDGKEPDERERDLKEDLVERMSTAEISDVKIENVTDLNQPYRYSYSVRVPGYAMQTGKRLFLQPAYFQLNLAPRFKTSERKHPIYFSYGWTEKDHVTIDIPEGFTLENPDAPGSLKFGQAGHYDVKLSRGSDRQLVYEREFVFGYKGIVMFAPEIYPMLKQAFDRCHESDNHALTLRRAADQPSS